jgi:DNA-binding CsgD family transcriptional regulator
MSRLQDIASKVAASRSEHQLVAVLVDECPALLDADTVGIMRFRDAAAADEIEATSGLDRFIERYERELRPNDPMLKRMLEQHRPVRDLDVVAREHWSANPLYTEVAVPYGMVRCMQSPIIGDGRLTGSINVARRRDAPFSEDDAQRLASVSMHVSVQLARLQSMPLALSRMRSVLTEREVEVSLLVAKGLTNAQIGHVLGVSVNAIKGSLGRAFRKLGIESRVELVAILFDGL